MPLKSETTDRFWKAYRALPLQARQQARRAYRRFIDDPQHPSLNFKPVIPGEGIYSVRVSLNYRALGWLNGDVIVWFWIGTHSDYDKLLAQG